MSGNALKQNTVKSSRVFGDYIIMLVAPCIVALWYYGTRVLSVLAVSIATALICDFAACALLGKSFRIKDLSNIVIGAVIAMMMPASIPLYIPAVAAAFAVVAVKIPFGGALHTSFCKRMLQRAGFFLHGQSERKIPRLKLARLAFDQRQLRAP